MLDWTDRHFRYFMRLITLINAICVICASQKLVLEFQEEIFPRLLAAAVLTIAKTACKACLLAAREHHCASVVVFLQGIEQGTRKAEVALHKLGGLLWSVHSCQVEHKVRLLASLLQFLGRGVDVILVDFLYLHVIVPRLTVSYVFQLRTKVLTHESLCTRY